MTHEIRGYKIKKNLSAILIGTKIKFDVFKLLNNCYLIIKVLEAFSPFTLLSQQHASTFLFVVRNIDRIKLLLFYLKPLSQFSVEYVAKIMNID
jgi:hypothetical protein